VPTKKEVVLDAAIEVLGTRGSRGLTHRAVDEVAQVPTGTSSNYFRTRNALLEGIVVRLVERDRSDWEMLNALPVPDTVDGVIDGATAWLLYSLGPDRTRTAARYALFLESATTAELQPPLLRARRELVAWAEGLLSGIIDDPAGVVTILMDYVEGATLHQLCLPVPDFDPRPAIAKLVRSFV